MCISASGRGGGSKEGGSRGPLTGRPARPTITQPCHWGLSVLNPRSQAVPLANITHRHEQRQKTKSSTATQRRGRERERERENTSRCKGEHAAFSLSRAVSCTEGWRWDPTPATIMPPVGAGPLHGTLTDGQDESTAARGVVGSFPCVACGQREEAMISTEEQC